MMGQTNKGMSLLSILVASLFVIIGLVFFFRSINSSDKVTTAVSEIYVAEVYATELLELLRGHSTAQLKAYLSNNPHKPPNHSTGTCIGCTDCTQVACGTCRSCTPYTLCAHINILDRKNSQGNVLNSDPLAVLPSNNTLEGATAVTKANRFYQVQVVEGSTLTPVASACGQTAAAYTLTATQRYLITAGVSWVPKGQTESDAQRVVLTTVIP